MLLPKKVAHRKVRIGKTKATRLAVTTWHSATTVSRASTMSVSPAVRSSPLVRR